MKLLIDQNVHRRVVLCLRKAGYDVEFILETMPGRLDQEILARTDISTLVFITGDKGFGDWVFNQGLLAPLAILLSRLPHGEWQATADRLIEVLEGGASPGQITILIKDGVRRRALPSGVNNG
ncbi:DUF5615 family PIN-like protein [uncultured Sphingomonas sp.]|uniref:DUF5615 family PIN-like protein n=1 Tax=uncultured Sphingomonas sp. TaxID=158754 RepID=UPI0035C9EB75